MSLDFNTSKIEGFADSEYCDTPFDVEWHPVTSCIVHRMMHTGLGWELTDKNAAEFYARCKFADLLGGVLLYMHGKEQEITPQMIKDHIGLTVNVSPETRSTFIKRYTSVSFTRWVFAFNKELENV
jgi:hypothetical protein